jgi:hypothetical protein
MARFLADHRTPAKGERPDVIAGVQNSCGGDAGTIGRAQTFL